MIFCPNKNLKEWKKMVEVLGESKAHYFFNLNNGDFLTDQQLEDFKTSSNIVKYDLKLPKIIMDKYDQFEKLFKQYKSKKDFFNKLLDIKYGIPKEQVLLLEQLYEGQPFNELILDFIATYGYTVEVNTNKFKENYRDPFDVLDPYDRDQTFYGNLTVPGGANYTENEIATPFITPNIKGHAQFSTDKGIGWFRSDDKAFVTSDKNFYRQYLKEKNVIGEYEDIVNSEEFQEWVVEAKLAADKFEKSQAKTRRILEVQSDLFQKGRDKEKLVKEGTFQQTEVTKSEFEEAKNKGEILEDNWSWISINYKGNIYRYFKHNVVDKFTKEPNTGDFKSQNQFLQLLNKNNNWVTFFVKSIIQDSIKKGYEKVLFPSGNTASKVEGHASLEDFKKQQEDRLKFLEGEINDPENKQSRIELAKLEKEQVEKELERVEREGFGALRPIYNFYENTVKNILKKNYTVNQITDEYGNTWNEISLNSIEEPILLNIEDLTAEKSTDEELEILLKQFCEKFGIKVEVIDNLKLRGQNAQGLANILKSLIQLDKTASTEVFTEEVSHFTIELLGSNNPHVKRLMRLIDKTSTYKDVKSSTYSEAYNNDENLLRKEAIGKLLALAIKSEFKVQEDNNIISALKGVYNFFLRMINPIVNNRFYEAEIDFITKKIARNVLSNTLNGTKDNLTEDLTLASFLIENEQQMMEVILNTVKNRKNQLSSEISKNPDATTVERSRIKDIESYMNRENPLKKSVINELIKQIDKDLVGFLTDLDERNPSLVTKFKQNKNNFQITSDELSKIYRFTQNYKSALIDIISYLQLNHNDNKYYENVIGLLIQKKNDIEQLESYYQAWEKAVLTNILKDGKDEYDFPYTIEELVNKLYESKTTKDSSTFRVWFGILRNASNPIVRLMASKLSKALWIVKNHKIEKAQVLLEKYNKVKNKVNFEDFVQEIEGELYLKRIYNIAQLEYEKNNFREDYLRKLATDLGQNYDDYVNRFDFFNTLKEEDKKKYFKAINQWTKDNFYDSEGKELPDYYIDDPYLFERRQEDGAMMKPKEKWLTKDLPSYFNDPDVQDWYNYLVQMREEDLKRLPNKYNKVNKETGEPLSLYKLPQISKNFLESWKSTSEIKDYILNNSTVISEDVMEYGEKATDYFGNEIKKVPIAYFDKVNSPSKDLNYLFMAFTEMSKNYEVMSKQAVDADIVLNRFEKKQYATKNNVYTGKESNDYQALEALFTRVIYGRKTNKLIVEIPSREKDEKGNFKKREVDISKIMNGFLNYVRKNNLALNITSMLSSVVQGSKDADLELLINKKSDLDSTLKAKYTFLTNFPSVMMDIKSTSPKNMMHRILLKTGSIDMDSIIRNTENSAGARVMRDSPLMFGFEMGHYKIKSTIALSLMYHNKIKDGKLYTMKDVSKGKLTKEEYDKLPNVYDNFYLKDDKVEMTLPIDESSMIKLQQQIQFLAALADGQMTDVDKGKAYNSILGQNLLTHRNWLIVGIDRRFKRKIHDMVFDEEEIGYYRATGNMIKMMIQERALFLKFKLAVWDKLSEAEKRGVQRTLADFLILGGLVTIWALLQGAADDDDEWTMDFTAYLSSRVLLEHSSFLVPTEITALLKSPAASVGAIENVQNLVLSMFSDKMIDRGSYEGYTKREKAMIKLIPGLRAIIELEDPKYKNNYIKNNTLKVFKIFDPTSEE